MKNMFLRLSCFLIGYNFKIISNCSAFSKMKAVKYGSALLIIMSIWGIIGYNFSVQYLKLNTISSILGGILFAILILFIERQFLLAGKIKGFQKFVRFMLAFLMGFIGSLILDQIIFKEDIAKKKITADQEYVESTMVLKTNLLDNDIKNLDSTINEKEKERKILQDDVNKNPNISKTEIVTDKLGNTKTTIDSLKQRTTNVSNNILNKAVIISVANPKIKIVNNLNDEITKYREDKKIKEEEKRNIRKKLEKEVKEKAGFLDELEMLIGIITGSIISLVVYIILFLFIMSLELLIIIGKIYDSKSDFDIKMEKEQEIYIERVSLLLKKDT